MSDLEIVRIEKEQLAECVELFREVYLEPPYNETWTRQQATRYLIRFLEMDGEHSFFSRDCGGVQGVVVGFAYPWKDGTTYHVQELYVRLGARRRGIGEALLRHAVSSLRVEGATSVSLVANQGSPAAGFYEHLGLSQHRYYKFYSGRIG